MRNRLILSVILLLICCLMLSACEKTQVDDEYAYNTSIIKNPDAPIGGVADLTKIEEYHELSVKGIEPGYEIPDTDLVVESIGSYSGVYVEDGRNKKHDDVLTMLVYNASDQMVSYSEFIVRYGEKDEETCAFSPTNIRPGCRALVMCGDPEVKASDIKELKIGSGMQVLTDVPLLPEDAVGISFYDNQFVITNLSDRAIDELTIRYKYVTGANCYLGGVTGTAHAYHIEPYGTVKARGGKFSDVTCEIIAVEIIED